MKKDETHDKENDIDLCPLCGCSPKLYDKWIKNYGLVLLSQDIKLLEDSHEDLDLYEKVLLTLVMIKDTGDYSKIDDLIDALRVYLEGVEKDSAQQLTVLLQMKERINRDDENEENDESL